jgi:hypothetical protein
MNLHFGQKMFHGKYIEINTCNMKECNIQRKMIKRMIRMKLILILISSYQM